MVTIDPAQRIAAVRSFNRFYTWQIGLLQESYLDSPFSLAEVRVLYELAHGDSTTASALVKALRLDAGYLSRMLRSFESRGLVAREPSTADGRQRQLRLTEQGREAFAPLDARSRDAIGTMLRGLTEADQERLVKAMMTIERVLQDRPEAPIPYLIRPHQPGDMGWVVHRHGFSMHRNTAGTNGSRPSSPESWRGSSNISTLDASTAGSPNATER